MQKFLNFLNDLTLLPVLLSHCCQFESGSEPPYSTARSTELVGIWKDELCNNMIPPFAWYKTCNKLSRYSIAQQHSTQNINSNITQWLVKIFLWFSLNFKKLCRSMEVRPLLLYDRCRTEQHEKALHNVSYSFWFESEAYQTNLALFGLLWKQRFK